MFAPWDLVGASHTYFEGKPGPLWTVGRVFAVLVGRGQSAIVSVRVLVEGLVDVLDPCVTIFDQAFRVRAQNVDGTGELRCEDGLEMGESELFDEDTFLLFLFFPRELNHDVKLNQRPWVVVVELHNGPIVFSRLSQ